MCCQTCVWNKGKNTSLHLIDVIKKWFWREAELSRTRNVMVYTWNRFKMKLLKSHFSDSLWEINRFSYTREICWKHEMKLNTNRGPWFFTHDEVVQWLFYVIVTVMLVEAFLRSLMWKSLKISLISSSWEETSLRSFSSFSNKIKIRTSVRNFHSEVQKHFKFLNFVFP